MTPQPQPPNPSYPVTWEELRNIYADGLSLDKYDEIILRKTCASHQSHPAPSSAPCFWSEDDEGNWHTDCGQIHQFMDGTPEENHHRYCPYCGNSLRSTEAQPERKPGCYVDCPFDDLCANDVEKIQAIEARAAAKAREDERARVLKEAIEIIQNLYGGYSRDSAQDGKYTEGATDALDIAEQKIESLRRQPEKAGEG